jgi:chitodextrinase
MMGGRDISRLKILFIFLFICLMFCLFVWWPNQVLLLAAPANQNLLTKPGTIASTEMNPGWDNPNLMWDGDVKTYAKKKGLSRAGEGTIIWTFKTPQKITAYQFNGSVHGLGFQYLDYSVDGKNYRTFGKIANYMWNKPENGAAQITSITAIEGVTKIRLLLGKFDDEFLEFWMNEIGVYGEVDTTPPIVPKNLVATAGDTLVTLRWDKNSETDFSSYNVFMDGKKIKNTAKNEETITGLTNGKSYVFQVSAIDTVGNESSLSNPVSAAPQAPDTTPPKVPILKGSPGNGTAALEWTASPDEDLAGYIIYRNGKELEKVKLVNKITISGLENGLDYIFEVSAFDESGNVSKPSNVVKIRPELPVTDTEQEAGPDYLLVTWKKTEGAIGYRIYLNGRLITSVGANIFEYKITRKMGYMPGAISNMAEARAILADGSEGGSHNPTAPVMELGAGYGVLDAVKAGMEFVKLLNGWVLIAISIILANMIIAFIYVINKKNRTQGG